MLIPGIGGTGALFYRQIAGLSRSYRVTTYTLRDRADRIGVLVDDPARVIDTSGGAGNPAVVVGESFGGAVALSFALAQPARVGRLVLVNAFDRMHAQWRLALATAAVHTMPWRAMSPPAVGGLRTALLTRNAHSPVPSGDGCSPSRRLSIASAHASDVRRSSPTSRDPDSDSVHRSGTRCRGAVGAADARHDLARRRIRRAGARRSPAQLLAFPGR